MKTKTNIKLSAPMLRTLRFIASDARDCYSFDGNDAPTRATYAALESRGLISARPGEVYTLTVAGRDALAR